MNLVVLPKPTEILDISFRRARKQALKLKSERHSVKDAKGKSIKRIEESANSVIGIMDRATAGFPDMTKVNPFYKELIESTIDLEATLKALGQMSAERKIIKRLKGQAIGKIKGLKKEEIRQANETVREFYGRLSSLVKNLGKSIEIYNRAAKKLRELPKVKTDLPSAIIAGFPNTGKSTILGRVTGSQPQVASYPFTTKKLELGYLEHGYEKIQLIDTPGLLDRPFGERNKIEKKGIAALKHLAKLVVFVVDPTGQCGFSLEQQKKLLQEIQGEFKGVPVLVAVNKADLAAGEEMEMAEKAFPKALVEGKGRESGLGKAIAKALKN